MYTKEFLNGDVPCGLMQMNTREVYAAAQSLVREAERAQIELEDNPYTHLLVLKDGLWARFYDLPPRARARVENGDCDFPGWEA